MNGKKYLIGLDVGGTKMLGVLFTDDGEIVYKIAKPGGVMLDCGFDNMKTRYRDMLLELAAHTEEPIAAAYCAIATIGYYGDAMYEYLRAEVPFEKLRCEDDGPCLISGMLGHRDGCCVICGTGSSFFVRKGEEYYHIGGWGHLIDSCGSGYVLGCRAIRAAVRAHDGRRPPTMLNEIFEKKLGHPIWDDFLNIYGGGRAYIASFCDCLFEAVKQGDAAAKDIFDTCARDLADLITAGYERLGRKPFDVVFNGGVFEHHPEYAEAVKKMSPKEANVIFADMPPIYGCAVEAMHDAGKTCGEDFKRRFMEKIK